MKKFNGLVGLWLILLNSLQAQIILSEKGVEFAYPRINADATSMLYQSNKSGKWQLQVMNLRDSTIRECFSDSFNNYFPDWNPKQNLIAFTSDRDSNENVYVYDVSTSGIKRITTNDARNIHPYFSPDGRFILYSSTEGNGSLDIYRYEIKTGETLRLTATTEDETCARYNTSMDKIVFLKNGIMSDDIFVLDCVTFMQENITKTPQVRDGWPMFSSDSRWIYFSSMESGVFCIYRIRLKDGFKEHLTQALGGEEDARVFITATNDRIFYNKRRGNGIMILVKSFK